MTPRVAIGPAEVAGTSKALELALRAHHVDVELALWAPSPFGYPGGRVLGRLERIAYSAAAPFRRDVLHYQYGSTWARTIDAWWARLWRRTLVCTYHGDDCRIPSIAQRDYPARGRVVPMSRERWVRRRLRALGSVADAAVVADLELASYVEGSFRRVYVAPLPLLPAPAPTPVEPRAGPPVVLHAASDPVVKGTDQIRAAVEAAAARIPLEFRVLSGATHDEVVRALREADVVVDQLNSVTSGVFALEALRFGRPVFGEYDKAALAPYQSDLPVVRVTANTLASELESVLQDPRRRAELAAAGPAYVARNHDLERVGRSMLRIYDHARSAPHGVYAVSESGVAALG
jgi:glycosyltransferase involved in cell wall biosynthesis